MVARSAFRHRRREKTARSAILRRRHPRKKSSRQIVIDKVAITIAMLIVHFRILEISCRARKCAQLVARLNDRIDDV
jgi:hypothetical protein